MHSTGEHSGSSPVLAEPGGAGLIQGLLPEPEVFVERFRFGNAPTGSEHAVEFSPKQNESRRGAWLLPSTTSFYFLRSNCTENLSMQLLQDRESQDSLKTKQNQRRNWAAWKELCMGTFLNPLSYLFGREGRGSGEGKEGSHVFFDFPFTIHLLYNVFVNFRRGAGGTEAGCALGLVTHLEQLWGPPCCG